MSTHASVYLTFIIIEAVACLALCLISCLKVRSNFRLIVVGIFGYLLVDAVDYIVQSIASKNAGFSALMAENLLIFTLAVYLIQGLVLGFAAFFALKFAAMTSRPGHRHAFGIGAGMAVFSVLMTALRYHIPLYNYLIGNYSIDAETAEATQEYATELILQLESIPVVETAATLFEVLLTAVIVLAAGYYAAGGLRRGGYASCFLAAGAFFTVSAAKSLLNSYVSFWAAFAFLLLVAVAVILCFPLLNPEKEPDPTKSIENIA